MTEPSNAPYRRRLPDPAEWPSSRRDFADSAVRDTYAHANDLSWSVAGEDLAMEIEQVLSGAQPMPPQGRPMRLGDPGE